MRVLSTGDLLAGIRIGMTPDEVSAQISKNWDGHAKRREGDEWFCRRCGKRWATDEEEPDCD